MYFVSPRTNSRQKMWSTYVKKDRFWFESDQLRCSSYGYTSDKEHVILYDVLGSSSEKWSHMLNRCFFADKSQ